MKFKLKRKEKNKEEGQKKNKVKLNFTKGRITMSITVFAVCICLVTVLFIQFKTVQEVNVTDIENLRETELRAQLSTWKSKYDETNEKLTDVNSKIEEYNKELTANQQSTTALDNELLQSNILLGNTNVTGEGVVITLTDNNEAKIQASDLLDLVNELRFAGAEAISINEVRVTNMTDIVDISGKYILIKPKQRLSSPYVIKAIGNQTYLVSTLSLKNSGFIDSHTNSGQTVKLEKQRNIIIPKYIGTMEIKYMKEVNK